MPKATAQDAELILKLYELRRDPEMRRARSFLLSEFAGTDWEEIRPHWMTGSELDRHIRMATSYWEMVAAFVNRGLLDEDLFFDTHGEALVVWNKVKAIVPGARKQIRPTWLWNLERLARRQQAWRERTYPTAKRVIEAGSKLGGGALGRRAKRRGSEARHETPALMGSTFGKLFTITTFGESHGPAVGVIVDGVPPGIPIDAAWIQRDLDRRKPGQSAVTTQRKEPDQVEILSGVFEGVTTGATLALVVRSVDARSQDYADLKDLYRPGHADFTYWEKYGVRDYRGSGRSSGRETVGRVAAGAVARKLLEREGVRVQACTVQVGDLIARERDLDFIEQNPVRCPDRAVAPEMERAILAAREAGDSLGGVVETIATGVPPGLGDPVIDKLHARLAFGLMSIPAIKGFEVGAGFAAARMRGSENNDRMTPKGFVTNHAGGVLGGISTGEPIVTRIAVKPPSSIALPQKTMDRQGKERDFAIHGRHDPCLCPRVVPVAEAMTCLVLADALLRQRSIEGFRQK